MEKSELEEVQTDDLVRELIRRHDGCLICRRRDLNIDQDGDESARFEFGGGKYHAMGMALAFVVNAAFDQFKPVPEEGTGGGGE